MTVKVGGVEQNVKIVNTTEPGVDYRDAAGARVIGINMDNGATDADRASAAAAQLQAGVQYAERSTEGAASGISVTSQWQCARIHRQWRQCRSCTG
jgi:flagellar hook-associated protein 1 FlgK